jgi:hypothetical protein
MFASTGAKSGFMLDENEDVANVWDDERVGVDGGSVISPCWISR